MRSQLFVFGVVAVLSSSFSQVQAASGASPVAPLTTSSDPVAPKSPVILKTGVPFAGAKLEARSGSKASGTVTFTKEREGMAFWLVLFLGVRNVCGLVAMAVAVLCERVQNILGLGWVICFLVQFAFGRDTCFGWLPVRQVWC